MYRSEYLTLPLTSLPDDTLVYWEDEEAKPEITGITAGQFKEWILAHKEKTPFYDKYGEFRKYSVETVTETVVTLDYY
ncbi:hypothetical protein VP424E501_P0168 [Vibrio phage 424E50-1]|nr:hypothetical protein VP424E501_P0168 [Vibrio phage 424E50-1]